MCIRVASRRGGNDLVHCGDMPLQLLPPLYEDEDPADSYEMRSHPEELRVCRGETGAPGVHLVAKVREGVREGSEKRGRYNGVRRWGEEGDERGLRWSWGVVRKV